MTEEKINTEKRDFIKITTTSMLFMGCAIAVAPLIISLNPAHDTLALSAIEVDISSLQKGQSLKVMWQGKPIFIRRRTEKEIQLAQETDISKLKDAEKDSERVIGGKEEWIILIGICTHLGCVPIGEAGKYNGWFCPCHGSHYDTSGRIRKGPAPTNMQIPPYKFISDTTILIGENT